MKKFILAVMAFCTLGASQAFAIDNEPEEGFSNKIYVGMSIANLRNINTDSKVGYSIGWLGEYMLPGAAGTYVNFGADLSMQGAKLGDDKLRTHYVAVPIHIGYRYNITPKWGVYADFGPNFEFGMGGKWSETDQKFFKKASKGGCGADRFNCALGFRVGGEFNNKLSLTTGFDWGLTSTIDMPKPVKDIKTFNSTITLGYRF